MPSFDTIRLRITALTASQLRSMLSDPAFVARELNCTFAPELVSGSARGAVGVKIGKMSQSPTASYPWFTYWLLVQKAEKIGIGLVGFKGMPDPDQQVEIGYGMAPSYQGNGYMTEAVVGLVGWAFSQPGCRAVTAETLKQNLPSQRVLVKVGFHVVQETGQEMIWRIEKPEQENSRG